VITSLNGAPSQLPAGGLPLATTKGNDGEILAEDVNNLNQVFAFQSCQSNFMGLGSSVGIDSKTYYG
jgi:hypothetical protein